MDFVIDVRILLTCILLVVMGIALWAWARPANAFPPDGRAGAQNTLTSIFDHAPVATLWLDGSGLLWMANLRARTLMGIEPTAIHLMGRNMPEAEWQMRLLEDVQSVLTSPTGSGRSRTLNLPEEQRTWRWWVTAWHGGGLVFVDDVTTLQQAEQATHLLLSDLAHELRTPLATLATHLEVLRLPTVAPEIRAQSIEFLRDETQRLVRLVNNTLELGRLQSSSQLERRPLQLVPLVESVVAQLYGEAQAKGVEMSVDVQGTTGTNLPLVLGNADRLKQVMLNLLDNGIKYARPGDRLVVTLAMDMTGDVTGIRCSVCDSGPGIAAEHLPYVTRRFYRAVPSGMPGSGLGLALAAEIVRQHGAQLSVESRNVTLNDEDGNTLESTGTCVRFVLPIWTDGEMTA